MNFNSYFTIKHTSNLRILLLTLFFIVPLGTIYGQNQLITIAGKNITLLKAFDAIESQTQLSITYSRTKIDVNRTLSVDFKKQKLSIVLDKLLAGTGFTYKIEKGYIVLVPVPVKQEQTEATSKKIQGVIVDTNGDPVIGASIQEKGVAGKGTVSDLDGKFNLSVASNAVLLISYIGFQSLEVKVGNRTSLSLVLKEDHQLLDEVVVIGYGTMEKRAVTSSITSISSKDLVTGLGGSTIATALKGKISGMNVSETSSPNASASFQLRGVASINASSSPLIVIDGIPGGDLRSISQEDIQSIDVLKDASAGAIYGTRAAGGVILVTTKKAKEGPITLSYTGELSTEQVSRRLQVLDRDAFVRFGVGTDLGASTDWYGELLNEGALSQRHVVNLSGGGHTAKIYATIMAQDQKGIAIGDNRKDYSGRINANFNLLDDLLEIGLHIHSSGTDDGRPVRHARGNLPADENPGKPAGTNQKTAQTLRHHLHCPDHPARGGHPAVRAARSGRPGTLPLDLRNRCPGSHFHRVHLDIHPQEPSGLGLCRLLLHHGLHDGSLRDSDVPQPALLHAQSGTFPDARQRLIHPGKPGRDDIHSHSGRAARPGLFRCHLLGLPRKSPAQRTQLLMPCGQK